MKTPQANKIITQQEMMEYVDGVLPPTRKREIEKVIEHSPVLQREIAVLRAIRETVHHKTIVSPSKNFTPNLLKEILPMQQETWWFRVVKNSSNVFAMVLVLSIIGMILISDSDSSTNNSSLITKSIESYSIVYHSLKENASTFFKQVPIPNYEFPTSFSGKFILFGLAAMVVFVVVDEVFGKRYLQTRTKH